MRQHQRGFTLIEAIVAVVIAGLLLAATLPSAGTWIRNSRIRTTADSINAGLQQARNEAVRRNVQVGFYLVSDVDPTSMTDACALSSSSGGWVVGLASPAGRCASDRDTFLALRPAGEASFTVAAVDGSANPATSVLFNGYGQIANPAAITCVRISMPSDAATRALNIAVNAGGQVRMCDPAVTDNNDPRKCQPGCT